MQGPGGGAVWLKSEPGESIECVVKELPARLVWAGGAGAGIAGADGAGEENVGASPPG